MRVSGTDEQRDGERGQTTLDFAIGISIFLSVLLFILLFLPGMLSPFTQSAQAETVSSNRVADQLAQGTLASPSEPYVLDRYCTVEFFNDSTAPSQCDYDDGEVDEQGGVAESRQQVNITLRGNFTAAGNGNDLLCYNNTNVDSGLNETSSDPCTGDAVTLARGPPAPTNRPSITSVRVVAIDGTDATLQVEMW